MPRMETADLDADPSLFEYDDLEQLPERYRNLDEAERRRIEAARAVHSERRILHVDAATGRHVLRPFLSHLREREGVRLLEDTAAYDLITHEGRIHGALLEPPADGRKEDGDPTSEDGPTAVPAFAGATVLATGGIGGLYRDSTNPDGATGDGVALAALAGADVVLFDNLRPEAVERGVDALPADTLAEASGGIGVADVPAYAATGVDAIPMGRSPTPRRRSTTVSGPGSVPRASAGGERANVHPSVAGTRPRWTSTTPASRSGSRSRSCWWCRR